MRVLQTAMYFNPNDVDGLIPRSAGVRRSKNPGIGFAWFPGSVQFEIAARDLLPDSPTYAPNIYTIKLFADFAVRGVEKRFPKPAGLGLREGADWSESPVYHRSMRNWRIAEQVAHAEIAIEHSPIEGASFSSFLAKAPGIAIGAFVGYKIGGETPTLMLLTVPAGIIVVSSAIGVAKALERGLHKAVEQLIKQKIL